MAPHRPYSIKIFLPNGDPDGLAFGAALRSAQMGRQVGASLLSDLGDVIAVGTNEVPRAGGGSRRESIPTPEIIVEAPTAVTR